MGFRLKSGNRTSFKLMGGTDVSPAKDMKTGSYKQSFESPAKQWLGTEGEAQDKIYDEKGNHVGNWVNDKKVMFKDKPVKDKSIDKGDKKSPKKSQEDWQPAYPGADYSKEEIEKMSEVEKQQNIDGYTPKEQKQPTYEGTDEYRKEKDIPDEEFKKRGLKKPKKKSPAKQTTTTYADGTKKSKREQDFSERHAAEKAKEQKYPYPRKFTNKRTKTIVGEKSSGLGPRAKNSGMTRTQAARNRAEMSGIDSKSPYWYKINGKKATKTEYIKYQNKPGGDEPGKQTNDPTVSLAKKSGDKRKNNKASKRPTVLTEAQTKLLKK
jgi:hypothetical protein